MGSATGSQRETPTTPSAAEVAARATLRLRQDRAVTATARIHV
jgi:hypothetical protein